MAATGAVGGHDQVLGGGVDARHAGIGGAGHPAAEGRPRRGATLGEPVDVGPNPMFLAGLAGQWRAGHRARARRRPRLDLDDRGRHPSCRSAGPARTGAADPCHLAFAERVLDLRGELLGYTALGAPVGTGCPGRRRARRRTSPAPARNAARQAGVASAPGGHRLGAAGRLLVPDLGADRVRVLGLDGAAGRPSITTPTATSCCTRAPGPGHLVIAGDVADHRERTRPHARASSTSFDGREVAWCSIGDDVEAAGLGLLGDPADAHAASLLIGDRDTDALRRSPVRPRGHARSSSSRTVPTGRAASARCRTDARRAVRARGRPGSDSIAVVALDGRRAEESSASLEDAGARLPGADA